MKTVQKKKVTLMLDTSVYEGLRKQVGARGVGAFLTELARPYVSPPDIEAGYRAMARDTVREHMAREWTDAHDEAPTGENVWQK